MPRYDLKCTRCGHCFEHTMKMSDPNPLCEQRLPEPTHLGQIVFSPIFPEDSVASHENPVTYWVCGGSTEKIFTGLAAAVHFHGGGWAKDGYSR